MITLVGVGHVFGLDAHVKRIIHELHPGIVCLELDGERFEALREGFTGEDPNPFFNLIERFQNRIAKGFGSTPGSEMLAAAEASREVGARIALIDRDIRVTINRLLRLLPIKEKVILIVSGISTLFASKKWIQKELTRIQNEDSYIDEFTKDLPTFRRILIDERNEFMALRIMDLSRENSEIVAIIGDGHVPGVERILREKGIHLEVIRLRDIQKGKITNRVAAYRF
jgi:pheromone shutdown protein TraB